LLVGGVSARVLGNESTLKVDGELGRRDLSVAGAGVLLGDSLELRRRCRLGTENGAGNTDDFLLAVFACIQKGGRPSVASDVTTSNEDNGGSDLTWEVFEETVALEGAIEEVATQLDDALVGVTGLEEADQEGVSARDRDLVFQRLEHLFFRVEDVLSGVGAVC